MRPALLLLALAATTQAQWTLQPSGTTADLRGIHAVSDQIAWASGTSGTVLHTTDGGAHWLPCATPPQAERLDFRGIQAFDAQTAIVMSSGKGDLSRLYKTTDACQTWTLVFTNPDKEGFWDAISKQTGPDQAVTILGGPVDGRFSLWTLSSNAIAERSAHAPPAKANEAAFAASNSALLVGPCTFLIATGGTNGSQVLEYIGGFNFFDIATYKWRSEKVPLAHGTMSSGIFSIAVDRISAKSCEVTRVAVGGDYLKPDESNGTAAFLPDSSEHHWTAATTPPHGYRSSVAYNPAQKSWITVGPNGTDLSTDDGRNWHPLLPGPGEPPDSDRNWNALSLPFVVGPYGRIGRLNQSH